MPMNRYSQLLLPISLCMLTLFSSCGGSEVQDQPGSPGASSAKPKPDTVVSDFGNSGTIRYFEGDTLMREKAYQLTSERSYYPSGQVQEEIRYADDPGSYTYTHYHPNGKVKTTAKQIAIGGCGVESGERKEYDADGNLMQQRHTEVFLPNPEAGCHDTRMVIHVQEFFPGDKLKADHWIETCYECIECPCGLRVEYDEDGKELSRASFGDCYDYEMDCEDE